MIVPGPGERPARRQVALLVGLTALALAPFLAKPIHIDDPLFVWTAQRISTHPLDPYGLAVNWYGTAAPLAEIVKNPPLASYYMAAVAAVLGWEEAALHAAFLAPACACVVFGFLLARWAGARAPLEAGAFILAAPAFLVSSSTLMCDTTMLACAMGAAYFWVTGIDRERPGRLAAGAALAALAVLAKYFAIFLVPLLALYAVLRTRRAGAWIGFLALPALVLIGYEALSRSLYARGLVLDSVGYAWERRLGTAEGDALARIPSTLAFLGGGAIATLFAAPSLLSRRTLLLASGATAAAALAFSSAPSLGAYALPQAAADRALFAAQLALFGAAGAGAIVLAVVELWRRRDPATVLLATWIVGTFVFAAAVNWTVNARSILPMIPALGILVARRMEGKPAWERALPLVLSAAVALAATHADARLARTTRDAARALAAAHGRGTGAVWFQGHWGFQYYMEKAGARLIDVKRPGPVSGDAIVLPLNNTNVLEPRSERFVLLTRQSFPVAPWIATMSRPVGARFYAFGPLPFAFGRVPREEYRVYRLR